MEEETLDKILDGHLRVFQKKKGYRFSLDSILLAHFVSLKPRTCAIDLGCGNGIILLILAKRFPHINCTGLEIQENLALLAQKNTQLNGLDSRIKILAGDAQKIKDSGIDTRFLGNALHPSEPIEISNGKEEEELDNEPPT